MLRKNALYGVALAALMAGPASAGDVEWFPPDPPNAAAIGECYARIRIPAEFDSYSERVVTADAYEDYDVTDPRLRPEVVEYVRREAGLRYIVTEPVYETVTETVEIRPAYNEYVVQPPVHDTVTETIMVREPQLVWRRGYVPGARATRVDEETGEIWCLIEEPGEYRTVTRTIVVEQGSIREVTYPAEYATISREVLVQPARVEEVPIPAEYASYDIQVLDRAASVNREYYEERSESITRYTLRSGERFEWRLVDCEEIDIPAYGGHQPMASNEAAPSVSTPTSYIYGTEQTIQDHGQDEHVPVAQARSRRR